jgi:hypothetical protein
MADQKTFSKVGKRANNNALRLQEGSLSPALKNLVRLLARSAANEAFEASLIKPTDANDAKD